MSTTGTRRNPEEGVGFPWDHERVLCQQYCFLCFVGMLWHNVFQRSYQIFWRDHVYIVLLLVTGTLLFCDLGGISIYLDAKESSLYVVVTVMLWAELGPNCCTPELANLRFLFCLCLSQRWLKTDSSTHRGLTKPARLLTFFPFHFAVSQFSLTYTVLLSLLKVPLFELQHDILQVRKRYSPC